MSGGGGGGEAPSVASSLPAFYALGIPLRERRRDDASLDEEARKQHVVRRTRELVVFSCLLLHAGDIAVVILRWNVASLIAGPIDRSESRAATISVCRCCTSAQSPALSLVGISYLALSRERFHRPFASFVSSLCSSVDSRSSRFSRSVSHET